MLLSILFIFHITKYLKGLGNCFCIAELNFFPIWPGPVEGVSDQGWHVLVTQGAHDAWQSRLYTDLTIKTQDQVIHAHKVILAAASPYFRLGLAKLGRL